MIVESMSFQQMRSQTLADYVAVTAKAHQHVPAILKVMRKTRMTKFFKYYEFTTARNHNKWLYSIQSDGTQAGTFIGTICYFYSGNNINALMVDATGQNITYFTSHFFERYAQRKQKNYNSIRELMVNFLHNNRQNVINQTSKPDASGSYEVSVQSKEGVGLGTMHKTINFLELRTFINNDMLKGSQVQTSYQIEQDFNLDIDRPKEKNIKERPYLLKIIFPLPANYTPILNQGATRNNTAFLRFL